MTAIDGVIKFRQHFTKRDPLEFEVLKELDSWRRIFYSLGIIGGNDRERYEGLGFGNVSERVNKNLGDQFVITGTQTGHIPRLSQIHYTTITKSEPEKNLVFCEGPIEASSESMTHGVLYSLDESTNFVFHTHSSEIWNNRERLRIPTTREKVEYGTPEMAHEVKRLYGDGELVEKRIFAMGGHRDGIVTFGNNSSEAGLIMISYLAKSLVL